MQSQGFSKADVELLKSSPSEPVKISLIDKLHTSLRINELSGSERIVAEEIIRFLAADISISVRESIASKFCDSNVLPYDIALRLANDLEDIVAIPIIQNSKLLADKDLINIIEQGNIDRQKAVARRQVLSEKLCTHLIDRTTLPVLDALINNSSIQLTPQHCESIIRNNTANQPLMKALISTKKITSEQAHDLLTMVSEDLQKLLIIEYNIPGNVVANLIQESKETMIVNMIMSNLETKNQLTLDQMINRLYADKELSFSVLIRSLSFGNLAFFETALAKIAGISTAEVREKLWNSGGDDGFRQIYHKCNLPESMIQAVQKLAKITHEEIQNDDPEAATIYYRILNRLARISNNEKILNLDYLVTIVAYNLKKSNLL